MFLFSTMRKIIFLHNVKDIFSSHFLEGFIFFSKGFWEENKSFQKWEENISFTLWRTKYSPFWEEKKFFSKWRINSFSRRFFEKNNILSHGGIPVKHPPISAIWVVFLLFWGVFCDFFKSYGSNTKTLIMFFVVLWEVVSPLKAIFDIMTQNRENRKKQVQKWVIFMPF